MTNESSEPATVTDRLTSDLYAARCVTGFPAWEHFGQVNHPDRDDVIGLLVRIPTADTFRIWDGRCLISCPRPWAESLAANRRGTREHYKPGPTEERWEIIARNHLDQAKSSADEAIAEFRQELAEAGSDDEKLDLALIDRGGEFASAFVRKLHVKRMLAALDMTGEPWEVAAVFTGAYEAALEQCHTEMLSSQIYTSRWRRKYAHQQAISLTTLVERLRPCYDVAIGARYQPSGE